MRLKSKWHKKGKARDPEEQGGALGFILWGIAVDRVKHMEQNNFKIDLPQETLAVISEVLAFLIQAVDRLIFDQVDDDTRGRIINATAHHLDDTIQDNARDLLGVEDYGHFFEILNDRLNQYAEWPWEDDEPGYSHRRLLGQSVAEAVSEIDPRFVAEQIIEVEAPEAMALLRRGLGNLFETAGED